MHLHLPDAHATDVLGHALAATRPQPAVVHLHGDLGAGKTQFSAGVAEALGYAGAVTGDPLAIKRWLLRHEGVIWPPA